MIKLKLADALLLVFVIGFLVISFIDASNNKPSPSELRYANGGYTQHAR